MEKLLLIALLIVGCDNSTTEHPHEHACDICDVLWLAKITPVQEIINKTLYITDGYTPEKIFRDTTSTLYITAYIEAIDTFYISCIPITADPDDPSLDIDCAVYTLLTSQVDSVKTISHFVNQDYFVLTPLETNYPTLNYLIHNSDSDSGWFSITYEYK